MMLVVLPDLANTFFSKILRGIEETLFDAGYGMIISDLDGSPAKEAHFAAFTARAGRRGASFSMAICSGRAGTARASRRIAVPLVALCEAIPSADIPQIGIDNRAAARTMTEFSRLSGAQEIAYVSGPPAMSSRKNGFAGIEMGFRRPVFRSTTAWSSRATIRWNRALRRSSPAHPSELSDRRLLHER